jgi:hypothetical protein
MSTVAEIEEAIEALPPREFDTLAAWFRERLAARVDAAFERNILDGKFDALAEKSLRAAAAGKSIALDEFLRRA